LGSNNADLNDLLLVDNYDSFTHILAYLLRMQGAEVEVRRNDSFDLSYARRFRRLVISPGPGLPRDAGISPELIDDRMGKVSMLGVCLGHQALGEALGGTLYRLQKAKHGREGRLSMHRAGGLLCGLEKSDVRVGLYHSWAVDPAHIKADVLATDSDGVLMAFEESSLGVYAVQFHPESILSSHGREILSNYLGLSQSIRATLSADFPRTSPSS